MSDNIIKGDFGTRVPPSNGGGGDGTMERLVRLEGKVDNLEASLSRQDTRLGGIDDRLRSVERDGATLLERVAHLPSKGFIVTTLLTSLTVIAGLILFQGQIQALLTLSGP